MENKTKRSVLVVVLGIILIGVILSVYYRDRLPYMSLLAGLFNVNSVQTVIANDQPGADLGAKINAADAVCGLNVVCEIRVNDAGSVAANTISTQVVVGSNHTLKFYNGTFYSNVNASNGVIRLKDNSALTGTGWDAIIVENNDPDVQGGYNPENGLNLGWRFPKYAVVVPYNAAFSCSRNLLNGTCRASNINISNIQIKGVRTNQHDGGTGTTVGLAHCWECSVRSVWFNETAGYAIQVGSTPADEDGQLATPYTDPSTGEIRYGANYAKNVVLADNLMTNLQSQSLALITLENVRVERNEFRGVAKRPYTITNVSNVAGQPIIITLNEAHHMFAGSGVQLRGIVSNGGARLIDPNTTYRVRPLTPTTFSLNSSTINSGTASNPRYITPITATGTGSYGLSSDSKTNYQSIIAVGIDIEPNGNSDWERVKNLSILNNLFDFRVINGTYVTGIAYQITEQGLLNSGGVISGNRFWGNETGTGAMVLGINIANPYTTGVTINNNEVRKVSGSGIYLSGSDISANNNTVVDSGGGGNSSLETFNLSNSTITNTTVTNTTYGSSSFLESGIGSNNTWRNNTVNVHLHAPGSTITNSLYEDNIWNETANNYYNGFSEVTGSNRNTFYGNTSRPRNITPGHYGLTTVGAASRILYHIFTDGTFIGTPTTGTSITSFTAAPNPITLGESSTLSWAVTGATSVSIAGIGVVTGNSIPVSPIVTTSYVLTATNGATTRTATVTVTVNPTNGNLPVISSFTASPSNINAGDNSTLSWNVTGATSVSIDQEIGTVSSSGNRSVRPNTETTYTLTARNSSGSRTASVTINVRRSHESPPIISLFTAIPNRIHPGNTSVLNWNVTGATSISISPGIGIVNGNSVSVHPNTDTVYELTATNAAGETTSSKTVVTVVALQ